MHYYFGTYMLSNDYGVIEKDYIKNYFVKSCEKLNCDNIKKLIHNNIKEDNAIKKSN